MVNLYQGDCLEEMGKVADHSVDMIFTDLPYGTTHNVWDVPIPLDTLWDQYRRVLKPGGAVLLFAQMPFGADLINSNRRWYRYEWIWHKTLPFGFLNANRMPLRTHENILVFYEHLPTYHPQKTPGSPYQKPYHAKQSARPTRNYGRFKQIPTINRDGMRYPRDVLTFSNGNHANKIHPTEKPVDLLEYMIRTYTDADDTVLDSCMGSGSCGVACQHLGRSFIGIEKDMVYFEAAKKRIEEAAKQ